MRSHRFFPAQKRLACITGKRALRCVLKLPQDRVELPFFNQRRRGGRVLDLDPVLTCPRCIRPVPMLRNHAFKAHQAGRGEHVRSVALQCSE